MFSEIFLLTSHLFCVGLSYYLLTDLIDWSKWIHSRRATPGKVQVLVLCLAIGMGFLMSHFLVDLITIGQSFSGRFAS